MRKGERKLLKDSIIQYVKENTAKISLEELDTVLTAEAIAGYFQVKRNTVSYYLNQEIGKTFFKINTRPVRFLDKKVFEKNFFTVSKDVYASVNDLLDENKRKNGIQKEEKQEINFVEEQDVFQNLITDENFYFLSQYQSSSVSSRADRIREKFYGKKNL